MSGVLTVTYRAELRAPGSATWSAVPNLLRVTDVGEAALDSAGVASEVTARATLECTLANLANVWKNYHVRIFLSASDNGAPAVEGQVFGGVITRRRVGQYQLDYQAEGYDALIRKRKVRTQLRYKAFVATETTPLSQEDPDSLGYQGGILNEWFWRAGGRPADQAGLYPTADFYYACDASAIVIEWAWADGEDIYAEMINLARVAGGMIYQGQDGIMRYASPLMLAEPPGGSVATLDQGVFGTLDFDEEVIDAPTSVACRFVRRSLQGAQQIYEERQSFVLANGSSVNKTLAMDWPIYVYGAITVEAVTYDGAPLTLTVSTVSAYAQLLTITITNSTGQMAIVDRIAVDGQPVTAERDGEMRYEVVATPAIEVSIEDSEYTQAPSTARQQARRYYDFASQSRPLYRLSDCPLDIQRYIGEYVLLTANRYGISSAPCRIVRMDRQESGTRVSYTLLPLTGLPKRSDFFIVGETYASGDVRQYGY